MLDKIACIDDDNISLLVARLTIPKSGITREVVTFSDPEEALAYFRNCLENGVDPDMPRLILLDLNMPVIGGWEFLDLMQACPAFSREVKVVILTSSPSPDDRQRAGTYPNVIDFFCKPLTVEMLQTLPANLTP